MLDAIDSGGSGTPLVLLHGFPLNKETWDVQAAALEHEARVIRFDVRGLGASNVPDGPYLMTALAGDVAAVLDALGVESAVIAGHSLGSYVAFAFFRLFAERVRALGIVTGSALADEPDVKLRRYELADRVEREGAAALIESYVPRYFGPSVYEKRRDLVEKVTGIVGAADPAGAAGLLRGMAERDPSDDLFEDILVPVAIFAGSEDAFNPLERNEDLRQSIEGATLTVEACGHFPQWEAPGATTRFLRDLIARAT